jgi:cytochrome b6-f complex iron-sulfur subunit
MSEPTANPGTPSPTPPDPAQITATPPAPAPDASKVTATPPKPAAPAKPPAKPPAKTGKSRRFFLFDALGLAWAALAASLAGMVLGTVRFLYPNVLFEPPSQFKVGTADRYEDGKVNERYKDQGAWIVRLRDDRLGKDIIYALSTTCTHLGCTPNWLEKEGKFKCPCHGSGFKITGINFEGPAPRPLERWAIKKEADGTIVVDKSKKFQQEMGQWTNTDSFIEV